MKFKTAFRLALKVIGVWLIAERVSAVVFMASLLIAAWGDPSAGYKWRVFAEAAVGNGLGIGLGLYLFFGGKWIVNLAIPSNRPYCHECGYELTGSISGVCPECGTANPPAGKTPQTPGVAAPRRGD